jgi:ligand-binding sensor domain-containing protein
MTTYLSHKLLFTILLVSIFINSCNGQPKKNSPKTSESNPQKLSVGQPKLIRTQGSNEYQNISCGLQDKLGNLWFGTTGEGVYRYDGKFFTQFTVENGLSNNNISSILEDNAGNIWLGTTDGICRYDGKKITQIPISKSFVSVTGNSNYYTKQSTKNTVWSMLQDKSGKIWFGTGDGVYWYNGVSFTHFLNNDGVINKENLHIKMVACMLEDKNGNIWFGSGMPPGMEGLCRYDGKSIVRYFPNNEKWIRSIIESKNGNIILATRNSGIINYDGKKFTKSIQPKDLYKGSLREIMEDKAENLWISSEYGYSIGDTLGGVWRSTMATTPSTEKTFTKITSEAVFFMLEDKNLNIWIGTRNMGLYKYDGKKLISYTE